jgi:hypothetical protein
MVMREAPREFIANLNATCPPCTGFIQADLIGLRRIHAIEPKPLVLKDDGIPIHNQRAPSQLRLFTQARG